MSLLLSTLLAACGGTGPRLANDRPGASVRLAIPPGGRISAGPNDTVYEISRRYGVPVRDIILANGLQPPYKLDVGQDLRLPAPSNYLVRPGDTVFSISRRFNVDMRTVVQMNGIAPPYQIRVGQELRLPSREVAVASAASPATLPEGPGARGDRTRTALLSPGNVALPAPNPRAGTSVASAPARPTVPALAPVQPKRSATPTPKQKTGLEVARIRPPGRAGSTFRWPVRGRIIANFGPRAGGLHNDGINIAAPRGAPVGAAENGVVAYAGDGLPGFGKLLLLKHSGGWITAYAHSDKLLVKRGDVVRRGQTIATVGSSGSVDRPQLHFEVRREKRAVDPRDYLEKS
ncbi:LysM peptidoglycan-binding domain-containing M23 family metallopeptidase [Nisaea acidiphila]|uniref:LysM peptidoglycan-binding domain-containing M23 family metallopeptidase n=1 Tax=Nisaea acidiphila TaxID=1862145 RepID=A0A9J7AXB2_9PROT|nr:LysM peptidoglycan-binding domain-containing M23 family metallopeptidase [Nisaea acidiphila]UUX50101.1 LysM peptidoglycan-binding domain-containing M23 family metallopeptidase [Nisaea acidiphila]